MKIVLKMVGIVIFAAILLIVAVTIIFVSTSPQFGGKITEDERKRFEGTGHYKDGKFLNQIPSEIEIGWKDVPYLLSQMFKRDPSRRPSAQLPVLKIDSLDIEQHPDSLTRITWFGHSAFLVEVAGKRILLDPMFGPAPSPHPAVGTRRYTKDLPIEIEKLPQIDAIILSHDHYDHLDYGSISQLRQKTKEFYVPLGVGAHLRKWNVAPEHVHELDWWEETKFDSLVFACTPARHFSGRGFTDRAATLWASWVIKAPGAKIYFSGDSGYGPHFKQIGEKYGPFDFAMLECGQYGDKWKAIHMTPEETVQSAVDVKAEAAMPIHWGAFTLAFHSWTDPVMRATKKAAEMNVPFYTPKIGQPIVLTREIPSSRWWEEIN